MPTNPKLRNTIIQTSELSKIYGDVVALDSLNLAISEHSMFGLIGMVSVIGAIIVMQNVIVGDKEFGIAGWSVMFVALAV